MRQEEMRETGRKIAVIGSINMDLTARTQRLPGKGETLAAERMDYVPGGKGANQAVAAARLGADVTMFGCVGDDAFGGRLIENLRQNGVHTEYVRRLEGISSGLALITVAEKDNCIVVVPGANGQVSPAYLESVRDQVLQADIVLLQNEIPEETIEAAVDLCSRAGKTILYNPAPMRPVPEDLVEKVTYLTPNEHEAALLFPDAKDLEELMKAGSGRLIVTLGSEGVAACREGEILRIPARPAKVADTTGAGDTFNGAFACALARGKELEEALVFANTAASLSTERYGAQGGMPTAEEVKAALGKDSC